MLPRQVIAWGCVVILAAALIGAAVPAAGQTQAGPGICSQCGKTLSGTYYKTADKAYCGAACALAARPACAACGGKNLTGGFTWEGRYVCSQACLDRLRPKCAVCGKPVAGGTGVKSEGLFYCSTACWEQTLPECSICGVSTDRIFTIHGRSFCEKCQASSKCAQCSAPAGNGLLPDGRPFCEPCRAAGVTDPARAETIFRDVQRTLHDEFGVVTDPVILFHLVDLPDFRAAGGGDDIAEHGLYKATVVTTTDTVTLMGVEVSRTDNAAQVTGKNIYILSWLDEPHFRCVAAHELMHDWTRTCFGDLPEDMVVEGISEYGAWLINARDGRTELNQTLEANTDLVYGDGFRLVRAQDKGGRLADIIPWVRSGAWQKDVADLQAAREAATVPAPAP
ncbi:MAG: hypothetical protein ABIF71_08430 [Planctomycetota bacterium]